MRIAIFSNDVVPGMSVPVAAPGLRAWGLAHGLREHGHEVTVVIDDRVTPRAWRRAVPPSMPRHTLALHPRDLQKYVTNHGFDALVVTNSNPVEWLDDDLPFALVYDFFAPKMLEQEEHLRSVPPQQAEAKREALAARKIRGLRLCDGVIINGAKKVGYVDEWLARAGSDVPRTVVNMALPPVEPRTSAGGRLQVVISGYVQPWSRPGRWVDEIWPLLDDGSINLHLMVGQHWGTEGTAQMPPAFAKFAQHPQVIEHGPLEFRDFRTMLSHCDVSVDVFAHNPERDLAMVTRSVVALSCGVPVVHVPFTEVSDLISAHDAGWLVEEEDSHAIAGIVAQVQADRDELHRRQAGAVALSRNVTAPGVATEPLNSMLEALA